MTENEPGRADPDRFYFDKKVRKILGVLAVTDDFPGPGDVTLRVVIGYGERIRQAAHLLAPPGTEVYVLEDHTVTFLPPDTDPEAFTPSQIIVTESERRDAEIRARFRRELETVRPPEHLRCDGLCRHRTTTHDVRMYSKCKRKVRVNRGHITCGGHYRAAPAPRRRWWGGVR